MQTKLRMAVIIFAASLLGVSLTSAASHPAQSQTKSLTRVKQAKTYSIGMASWYGERHQGRKMANGQRFDFHQLTAASWTLPLGTMIRVVNLENGKSVVVTISDRGPNQRLHRILDLSKAAAEQLNYVDRGLTPVFFSPGTYFDMREAEYDSILVEPPEAPAAVIVREAKAPAALPSGAPMASSQRKIGTQFEPGQGHFISSD